MAKLPPMARLHPEIERKIHAALEDRRAKRRPSSRIALSEIGRCVRDLWAQQHGIADERPPEGRALMTFDVGSAMERSVLEWLDWAQFSVQERAPDGHQWRVVMEDGIASGRLDGVIQWGNPRDRDFRLLEVKSAKAKKFEELVEAGAYRVWNPVYYDQVQAYMGGSQTTLGVEPLNDSLVIVVCKDDARIWAEMIRFDPTHYARLVEKARIAMGDEMPNRPSEAKGKSSKFCMWCSRKEWCYSPVAGVEFDQ
jgi:hypothetical protein